MDLIKTRAFLVTNCTLDRTCNIFAYILVTLGILSGWTLLWDVFHGHEDWISDFKQAPKVMLINAEEAQARDQNCTFWDCVNLYRCGQNGVDHITVFIYPLNEFVGHDDEKTIFTQEYLKILQAINMSPYSTSNPNEACLFVPSIDMLNQNTVKLSVLNKALASLQYWENGENHLIFNMLPGVSPNYNRAIDAATDRAIILGGGFDSLTYRSNFDISFPVWSPALNHFDESAVDNLQKSYLLIISQLNMLPAQLHVSEEISEEFLDEILNLVSCDEQAGVHKLVTCKGYKSNISYEYPLILSKSTFCLLGRSVRLGQPDLLEMLAYNCIPVISIDDYVLPFADVIDWSLAVIRIRERDLHSLMDRIKNISPIKIMELQQQGHWLFRRYFSNLQTITLTALEILNGRIFPHKSKNFRQWNVGDFNYKVPLYPLFLPLIAPKTQGFTAVVLSYDRVESLFKLIEQLSLVSSLQSILVIWNNQQKSPPHISTFPMIMKPVKIIQTPANKLSNRFYPYTEIETEAILTIDDDIIMLTADELDFGFEVWREFPDRIVGFPSRLHIWDNNTRRWHYESEWTNQISMVLTGAAFHHKFWSHMYTYALPGDIKNWVDERMNCEDIAMNFLVANLTNKPPIKVTPRKKFKCPECINNEMLSADVNHMRERSGCIDHFARIFGNMPLHSVEFRADPVLYKDNFPEKLKRFNDIGAL